MAVRLREADNIAAMAELQQQISELEIQVRFWLTLHPLHQALDFLNSLTNHITCKLPSAIKGNVPYKDVVTNLSYIFLGPMNTSSKVIPIIVTVWPGRFVVFSLSFFTGLRYAEGKENVWISINQSAFQSFDDMNLMCCFLMLPRRHQCQSNLVKPQPLPVPMKRILTF